MPVYTLEQLVRDLRLLGGGPSDDQPAIADEVAFVTASDGQQREPGLRRRGEPGRDDLPGPLNRSRTRRVLAFGVQGAQILSIPLVLWLQPQPLGLEVQEHRLVW